MPFKTKRFYWSTAEDEILVSLHQDAIDAKYPFGEYPEKGEMFDKADYDWIAERMTAHFDFQFDAVRVKERLDTLWMNVPAIWARLGVQRVGGIGAMDHIYWLMEGRTTFRAKAWHWFHRDRFILLKELADMLDKSAVIHVCLRQTNDEYPLYVNNYKTFEEARFGMLDGRIRVMFRERLRTEMFDTVEQAAEALYGYFSQTAATGT